MSGIIPVKCDIVGEIMKKIILLAAWVILLFSLSGCTGIRVKCITAEAENEIVYTGESVAVAFYKKQKQVDSAQIDYVVKLGDADSVSFDGGKISFEKAGKYIVDFYPKNEHMRSVSLLFSVTDAEHVIRGTSTENEAGGFEKTERPLNARLTLNNIPRAQNGSAVYSEILSGGAVAWEAETEIDLKSYYLAGKTFAGLRIVPQPAVKVLHKNMPVEDDSVKIYYLDESDDTLYDVTDTAKFVPRLKVMGYVSVLGDPLGTPRTDKMPTEDYTKLTVEKPETFIDAHTYKLLIVAKTPGRYRLTFALVNAEEPEEIYFTQEYLAVIA